MGSSHLDLSGGTNLASLANTAGTIAFHHALCWSGRIHSALSGHDARVQSTNDAELIAAALRDEGGAVDRLCERWLPVVLSWAIRIGGPRVDAEDITHEVFLVALRRLDSVRGPEAFPSWLYGITRRVLASHRRRAWFRRWLPGASTDVGHDERADPEGDAVRSQLSRQVWVALDELTDAHREILVLCDLEERPDSEVAQMLDIPRGTVKSRLRRARKELRGRLGAWSGVSLPDDDDEAPCTTRRAGAR